MKTLTGHLTATDKRNISAILAANLTEGKIKGKTYFLKEQAGIYTVKLQQKDKGLIPVPGSKQRISTYIATFKM